MNKKKNIVLNIIGVAIMSLGLIGIITFFDGGSTSPRKTSSPTVSNSTNKTTTPKTEKVVQQPKLEAIKVEVKNTGGSGKYVDINITVKNTGAININYVKINLFFKDGNGNIVKSEWTNDDSLIKIGAEQIITKMAEKDGWKTVSAEISEYH